MNPWKPQKKITITSSSGTMLQTNSSRVLCVMCGVTSSGPGAGGSAARIDARSPATITKKKIVR